MKSDAYAPIFMPNYYTIWNLWDSKRPMTYCLRFYLCTITGFLFYFSPCSMGGFDRRQETQSGDEASTLERRTVLLAQWIIL